MTINTIYILSKYDMMLILIPSLVILVKIISFNEFIDLDKQTTSQDNIL